MTRNNTRNGKWDVSARQRCSDPDGSHAPTPCANMKQRDSIVSLSWTHHMQRSLKRCPSWAMKAFPYHLRSTWWRSRIDQEEALLHRMHHHDAKLNSGYAISILSLFSPLQFIFYVMQSDLNIRIEIGKQWRHCSEYLPSARRWY